MLYLRYVLAATVNEFLQPFIGEDEAFDRNLALARHPGRGKCPILSPLVSDFLFGKARTGELLPLWVRVALALGM